MATNIVPRGTYYKTFAALLVLLALTVIASRMDRGIVNLAAALGIAFTKATLIGLFFMHVRYSSPLVRLVALAGLLWLGILMALTAGDYLTRDSGASTDNSPGPRHLAHHWLHSNHLATPRGNQGNGGSFLVRPAAHSMLSNPTVRPNWHPAWPESMVQEQRYRTLSQ